MIAHSYVQSLRARARTLTARLRLSHPPERVWPYVSNTDMINALSALPTIQVESGSDGTLTVKSQDLGLPIRYEELPYEWIAPHYLVVERLFSQGPIEYLRFESKLSPCEGGTEAELSLSVVPKLPWMLLKPRVSQILGRQQKAYAQLEKRLQGLRTLGNLAAPAQAFAIDPARQRLRIETLTREWQALTRDQQIPAAAAEYLFCAPDRYARRMRPFELARQQYLDEMETLRFFLRATKAGFLNLSWDLLCPSCQGAKSQSTSLTQLDPNVHCDACDIDFTGRFDDNFELTFWPVPSLRTLHDAPFCAGSPANTAHVEVQQNLWSGQTKTIVPDLKPGRYRFRATGIGELQAFEVAEEGLQSFVLDLDQTLSEPLVLRPDAEFTLSHQGEGFRTLKIENLAWREDRVHAGLVSTLQEFRDLFGSEVLKPGVNLAVSNLTVMFTDLKDSTRMYDVQGDAYAFNLVQDHFGVLLRLIEAYGGGVVKTIGDAVMAVFQDPAQAFACGLKILASFKAHNQAQPEHQIVIKLGLHRGHCIALNLNDRLDYFGATINKAARIQGESMGEDLVISEEVFEAVGLQSQLDGCRVTNFEKNLKGISETAMLWRVQLENKTADI